MRVLIMKLPVLIFILLLISGCTVETSELLYTIIANAAEPQAASGDAVRGEDIYRHGVNGAPPCVSCHALEPGGFAIAPDLHGVAARAGERVAELTGDDYLHQSIVDPHAFIVPGFRDMMYASYAQMLGEADIEDLIAFLKTL
jgi:mono/diheme cytochrome c family protein